MKKILSVTVSALVASTILTGCGPTEQAEDEIASYTPVPTTRPFENSVEMPGPGPNIDINSNTAVSEHGSAIKTELDKASSALQAAATFMEGNKVDGKYEQWLQYSTGPQSSVRVRILPHVSSSESYCLQAVSLEDPQMSVLYDSQTKKVLNDGQACSAVKGQSWESLNSSGDTENNS